MSDTSPTLDLDGYTPIPAGKIASVVTYLEMRARPARMREPEAALAVRRVETPQPDWYRALFRRIGEDWLWLSRLELSDEALLAIIGDPLVELYALTHDGADVGLLELDFRQAPALVELAFFGVVPEFTGAGAGRFLMNRANEIVWSRSVERLMVHTCTLDHPAAVGFYLKAGFTAYARAIEVADDPRLNGTLPLAAAPQIPVIER
ncbi:GNAT family N-acetyltransferase [Starkeya sp. ORNL1]|uniref:GNAT family N-acetyltransferase n=1 Tax=Starkeya sp. ORNL1 TaxID=2709380 RepID=UPI001463F09D|nr:GNAT family N-acetyltransferase [Starkeya sp. ORNL1]QJP17047.1 GNAT family N-acetyltransferase [Starkeya sp. ORNL1]